MGSSMVRMFRPEPACLVVQILGADPAVRAGTLHAAAVAAAVSRLGGSLELDAAGGPRLEIPLEL